MSVMKLLFGARAARTARGVRKVASAVKKQADKTVVSATRGETVALLGTGAFGFEVVGESHHQATLAAICGAETEEGHELECVATLTPEPTNPYDKKAVMVSIGGQKVAYLARKDATAFHRDMGSLGARGCAATCRAMVNGGWVRKRRGGATDRGHYGVELDLRWPLTRGP